VRFTLFHLLQPCSNFLGDALDIAAGGGGFVSVIGRRKFTGEFGFLLGGEIGDAKFLEQCSRVHAWNGLDFDLAKDHW
jgi:hypothetical protein